MQIFARTNLTSYDFILHNQPHRKTQKISTYRENTYVNSSWHSFLNSWPQFVNVTSERSRVLPSQFLKKPTKSKSFWKSVQMKISPGTRCNNLNKCGEAVVDAHTQAPLDMNQIHSWAQGAGAGEDFAEPGSDQKSRSSRDHYLTVLRRQSHPRRGCFKMQWACDDSGPLPPLTPNWGRTFHDVGWCVNHLAFSLHILPVLTQVPTKSARGRPVLWSITTYTTILLKQVDLWHDRTKGREIFALKTLKKKKKMRRSTGQWLGIPSALQLPI